MKKIVGSLFVVVLSLPAMSLPVFAQGQKSSSSEHQVIVEEKFFAKFQATYIGQLKPAFNAPYTGTNSLLPDRETGYSGSATAFFGYRPWAGGELHFNQEVIQLAAFSGLRGLGGLTNAEQQKTSGRKPKFYRARVFLRQTFSLGGAQEPVESSSLQLAGMVDRRRLVVTAGNVSVLDIFDSNAYAHDPRTQFLNWAFLTHGSYDYAGDARGYTNGAALEYYYDDWAVRVGRFMGPRESNGLALDSRLSIHHGDQIEIEHSHTVEDLPGKVRLLAFRNREKMGNFADAVRFAAANGGIPDVGNVRKDDLKIGLGLNVEQSLRSDVGVFARASWADGRSETYSFTEVENSVSAGIAIKGDKWTRPKDTLGLAVAQNGLGKSHRDYLSLGGVGAFIGDGKLNYRPERIAEIYYSMNLFSSNTITLGYQRIVNPAYNADRGPVNVFSLRLHSEF
ncbi:MAG: carbohydrate porin [Pseudomonadota bacterium]